MTSNIENLLRWRCIGPFRGGRVVAVAGDPTRSGVFYFGGCAGGVWKTEDAGTYWQNVSDGFLKTSSVGALAVAESDPNVIYAGMGESTIRIDVSYGDGVYKSTDAGRSWQHIGLAETRHIGKVRVHPTDPDTVYVAALGHAFGRNKERGVFKSTDGGKTWKHVLFKSEKAGAVDLSIDRNNPRIIYAAVWEAFRNFWNISSGGPDSGLWRSMDGGETWQDITQNKGLPSGVLGKIGVAASPAQPGRVWALVENEKGGMYRSDDYGDTWSYIAQNDELISRAWYYMHITPDPKDPETVYVNNLNLWKSTDGGKTYTEISTPHGDNHDLWIDPNDPKRMVQGNDGGACVSFNGGDTWSTLYNQPTAQFYHADTDSRDPYIVYGTQQDNSSIAVPSRSPWNSITWTDCFLAGTGESGYIAVKPDDPNIVYVGAIGSSPGGGNSLQRYDHRSKQTRLISTWPEATSGEGAINHKYRFAWTYPIVISPHDPNKIYVGGNVIFQSTNEGQSWQPIGPDLTRATPETLQPSGGPINRDSVGAEVYATVWAFAESPHEVGVLWAGTDDGLVHISRDGGQTWTNITPPDLPERTMISMIEPSAHDKATVYMAATRYKLDDPAPYLYKTTDYGATWTRIVDGIRDGDYTRAIREDPSRAGLLYCGTETGVYVSFDAGSHWQALQLNLPVSPIYDLKVKGSDLIAATHGRSFWILDDLTALHQLHDDLYGQPAALLQPRDVVRFTPKIFEGAFTSAPGKNYMATLGVVAAFTATSTPENDTVVTYLDSGDNPPRGAIIHYHLASAPETPIVMTFSDAAGRVLRTFTSTNDDIRKAESELPEGAPKPLHLTSAAGWNRFVWDMRCEEAARLDAHDPFGGTMMGPIVPPGKYVVTLQAFDQTLSAEITVVADPYSDTPQEDLEEQYAMLLQIRDKLSSANRGINRMRKVRGQLDAWCERLSGAAQTAELAQSASQLSDRVLAVEKTLLQPGLKKGWPGMLNSGQQISRKLAALQYDVNAGDYRPTDQAHEVYAGLAEQVDAKLAEFDNLLDGDLAEFNAMLQQYQINPIG
ncbi:MAG: glycosyl hydrolase [Chloroflexi bacterium]|nr:glycosyl hydrolase [Chloroflexota bacterium]